MSALLIVALLAVLVILWQRHSASKTMAFYAAQKYCQEQQVQLLDGTILLSKLYVGRNAQDKLRLIQRFQFEFTSTGERRYLGWVEFSGQRLVQQELQPHAF